MSNNEQGQYKVNMITHSYIWGNKGWYNYHLINTMPSEWHGMPPPPGAVDTMLIKIYEFSHLRKLF